MHIMHAPPYRIYFDPARRFWFVQFVRSKCGQSESQISVAKLNDAKVSGKLRKGSDRTFRFDGKTTLEVIAEVMAKAK